MTQIQSAEQVRADVQRNCHIADARHGTDFGMCTYLMKMREYYRWEKGLGFGARLGREAVGDWLSQREALWSELAEEDFSEVRVCGRGFDPFDSDGINTALEAQGLVYSAGLIGGAKPHFFLGRLMRKERPTEGFELCVADRELARGLNAPPAMSLGKTIFLRRESLRRYIWEKYESWRWNRPNNAFGRALACYPFDDDMTGSLDRMTDEELISVREHEIGESLAGERLGPAWEAMLLDLAMTPAELMARAVRDHLADCLRTLPMLARAEREASIHFFAGNLNAMRREIFPGVQTAYEAWRTRQDTGALLAIAELGAAHWEGVATDMLELHAAGGADAADAISMLVERNHL
jgi:hypothetical protein